MVERVGLQNLQRRELNNVGSNPTPYANKFKKRSLSFKVKHETFNFGKTGQYCQGAPLIFNLLKAFIGNTLDSQSVKIESLLGTIVYLVKTPLI